MRQSSGQPQTLEDAAKDACDRMGLTWRAGIPSDGSWHALDIHGDARGKDDGRIKLFADCQGGLIANWKLDACEAFFIYSPGEISPEESARRALIRRQAEDEEIRVRKKAQYVAGKLWERSTVEGAAAHTYTIKKAIKPIGARLLRDAKRGDAVEPALIIPVLSLETGELLTVQRIFADSQKRFLKGCSPSGGQFVLNPRPSGLVLVGEGYATMATAAEATGYQAVCAFSRSGLRAVAAYWQRQGREVIILAELDTDGLETAMKAAQGLGTFLAVPDFTDLDKTADDTDFNDLAARSSLGRVRRQIKAAMEGSGPPLGGGGGREERVSKQSEKPTGMPTHETSIHMPQKHLNGKAEHDRRPNGKASLDAEKICHLYQAVDESDLTDEHGPQLIKKILPRDDLTILAGQWGAGKTFMAINLAVCLSSGKPFFGHLVRERVGVLYVAGEGQGTIGARRRAAKLHLSIDAPLPIKIIKNLPRIKNREQAMITARNLRAIAEEMGLRFGIQMGAVILDTVSTIFQIENENDNAEMTKFGLMMRDMGREMDMAPIALHHLGKDTDRGLRGASSFEGVANHMLTVLAPKNNATGEVEKRSINILKTRIGEAGPMSGFEFKSILIGRDEDGEDEYSCAIISTDIPEKSDNKKSPGKEPKYALKAKEAIYEAILNSGRPINIRGDGPLLKCVTIEQVRKEFMSRYLSDENGGRTRGAYKAWTSALDFINECREFGKYEHGKVAYLWIVKSEIAKSHLSPSIESGDR